MKCEEYSFSYLITAKDYMGTIINKNKCLFKKDCISFFEECIAKESIDIRIVLVYNEREISLMYLSREIGRWKLQLSSNERYYILREMAELNAHPTFITDSVENNYNNVKYVINYILNKIEGTYKTMILGGFNFNI